jgi:hypothetical protein
LRIEAEVSRVAVTLRDDIGLKTSRAPDAPRLMFFRLSSRFWLLTALAILFFCSGACGLIYQVLWLRKRVVVCFV